VRSIWAPPSVEPAAEAEVERAPVGWAATRPEVRAPQERPRGFRISGRRSGERFGELPPQRYVTSPRRGRPWPEEDSSSELAAAAHTRRPRVGRRPIPAPASSRRRCDSARFGPGPPAKGRLDRPVGSSTARAPGIGEGGRRSRGSPRPLQRRHRRSIPRTRRRWPQSRRGSAPRRACAHAAGTGARTRKRSAARRRQSQRPPREGNISDRTPRTRSRGRSCCWEVGCSAGRRRWRPRTSTPSTR
jgi:hypothetical protein